MKIGNKEVIVTYISPFRYIKSKKKEGRGYLWNKDGILSFWNDLKAGFRKPLQRKIESANLIFSQVVYNKLFLKIEVREYFR